ncbi:MAG: hypothetical protein JRH01_01585 [Deltaproteobacteria bacterium]|nr:hypothetical protein [Deltaproteobacteria bacterium]MBW2395973.1 hypothetical protein [Deltaproteobacteria bacterium]
MALEVLGDLGEIERFRKEGVGALVEQACHVAHEEIDDDPATALEARIEASVSIFARYTADNLETLGNRLDSTA